MFVERLYSLRVAGCWLKVWVLFFLIPYIGEIAQLLNDIYKFLAFKGIFDIGYLIRSDALSVIRFDMLTVFITQNTQKNLTNILTYA